MYPPEETMAPWLSTERVAKSLITLRGYAGRVVFAWRTFTKYVFARSGSIHCVMFVYIVTKVLSKILFQAS